MSNLRSNLVRLGFANFFMGLVFWYGIEKIFMQMIGINEFGIGLVVAASLAFNFLFDIPSGLIADRWSRKGMLVVGVGAMALCSLLLGTANDLPIYLLGYSILGGTFVVATSGTTAAIVYDLLHEEKRSRDYSKIMGRISALYLAGIAVAELISGFLATATSFRFTFFLTILSCVIALIFILGVKEPTFHKKTQQKNQVRQLLRAARAISANEIIRILIVILAAMTIVQMFKNDFGQLYLLRYVSEPELIGILWAFGALCWAGGNILAHHFRARINLLIVLNVLPLVCMVFVDNWFSIVLFMVQHVALGALFNQIETRVQEVTDSSVRTSMLSVLSSFGRLVVIPMSLVIGWITNAYNIYWALVLVAGIAFAALAYWWWHYANHETRAAFNDLEH